MQVGYARFSSEDQNFNLQLDALTQTGCDKIFSDKVFGVSRIRPGLDEALSFLRAGDSLVVWKLDRLGRSVNDLIKLVGALNERGIDFKSVTEGIDTSSPPGRFFFHVMASLAQMEQGLLAERTRGICQ